MIIPEVMMQFQIWRGGDALVHRSDYIWAVENTHVHLTCIYFHFHVDKIFCIQSPMQKCFLSH